MNRPRVLLADDHAIVIEGLRRLLEPECEIVGAVQDGRALLRAAERTKPDVIVVDISMPLLNGIEAVRQIKKTARNIKVVFLTMHTDVDYAARALGVGGAAFVLKSSASDELVTAIREVMNGRKYVSPAVSSPALQAVANDGSKREGSVEPLTGRQREVLQLLAEGKTLKEVATILNVSPRTVEYHKYAIMEELQLRSTAELTQYAVRHGIVGR